MRGQALSDDRTLRLIDANFIPLWVNTTRDGIPDAPAFRDVSEWFEKTTSSFLTDWIATSFYLGSVVLSPDGTERLNDSKLPWPWKYKEVKPEDYVEMLEGALKRQSRESGSRP